MSRQNCEDCSRKIKSNDKFLNCAECRMNFHIKCLNINNSQYNSLKSLTSFRWFCKSCPKYHELDASYSEIKANKPEIDMFRDEFEENQKKVLEEFRKMTKTIQELDSKITEMRKELKFYEIKNNEEEISNTILIYGIEFKDKENLSEIVQQIFRFLKVNIPNENIVNISRSSRLEQIFTTFASKV